MAILAAPVAVPLAIFAGIFSIFSASIDTKK